MTSVDLEPIWLSLRLSLVTTVILFGVCVPFAWWLVQARPRIRYPVQAMVSMPLILPPTVLGFYLLLAFSPAFAPGRFLSEVLRLDLVFSFSGLVVGSVVFSLPFMMNPLISGLESLPQSLSEASYVMGKSKVETLVRVLLPNLKPALLSGIALTFAHTMGEFGVVLMIGGKIPGETRVASMAVYDEVEVMNYPAAHAYAFILFALSFVILLFLFVLNKKQQGLLEVR
jgi:molybdate transport system permease protein